MREEDEIAWMREGGEIAWMREGMKEINSSFVAPFQSFVRVKLEIIF